MSTFGSVDSSSPDTDDADTDEGSRPRSTFIALDALQVGHRQLLFDGDADRSPPLQAFSDGFGSRRRLINWWQAAAVRTLGYVSDDLPAQTLVRDEHFIREMTAPDGDPGYRRRATGALLEACSKAYRHLRHDANEYADTGPGESPVDPEEARHPALRPSLSRLDAMQAQALADVWGGLADWQALSEWLHDLSGPTYGTLDESFAQDVLADDRLVAVLVDDDVSHARIERERFVILALLPAFSDAAHQLRGEEHPDTDTDGLDFSGG